jgi:hypothetical protein
MQYIIDAMELQTEPDTYTPSVNHLGNYIDVVPSFNNLKNGLRCPCGSRKGKTYVTYCLFSAHTKTKIHQNWLENLNLNKANYLIECENLKSTVKEQRIVIAQLDREIQNKNLTIDYLTQQLILKNCVDSTVDNLLLFD